MIGRTGMESTSGLMEGAMLEVGKVVNNMDKVNSPQNRVTRALVSGIRGSECAGWMRIKVRSITIKREIELAGIYLYREFLCSVIVKFF